MAGIKAARDAAIRHAEKARDDDRSKAEAALAAAHAAELRARKGAPLK